MVVLGASGHAREIFDILSENHSTSCFYFFDNVTQDLPHIVNGTIKILRSFQELEAIFSSISNKYVIGVGNPSVRKLLAELADEAGGELESAIAESAYISPHVSLVSKGVNIMHDAFVSCDCKIGKACLINARVLVHHDALVGDYSALGPGTIITGGVEIGKFCTIGAGVTILPKVKIGDNAIVGAGSVVVKDVLPSTTVVGVPAKVL